MSSFPFVERINEGARHACVLAVFPYIAVQAPAKVSFADVGILWCVRREDPHPHVIERGVSCRVCIPEWNAEGTMNTEERVLITQSMKEVNQIMEAYVGIVRSNIRLIRAWNRLDILYEETERLFKRCKATRELCELRNMINIGYLITRQAMERKESRGLHYTIDYPHAN